MSNVADLVDSKDPILVPNSSRSLAQAKAVGSPITKKASAGQEPLSDLLTNALLQSSTRTLIFRLEEELTKFLQNPKMTRLQFPHNMSEFHTAIIDGVADYFHLEKNFTQKPSNGSSIVLSKNIRSKVPDRSFQVLYMELLPNNPETDVSQSSQQQNYSSSNSLVGSSSSYSRKKITQSKAVGSEVYSSMQDQSVVDRSDPARSAATQQQPQNEMSGSTGTAPLQNVVSSTTQTAATAAGTQVSYLPTSTSYVPYGYAWPTSYVQQPSNTNSSNYTTSPQYQTSATAYQTPTAGYASQPPTANQYSNQTYASGRNPSTASNSYATAAPSASNSYVAQDPSNGNWQTQQQYGQWQNSQNPVNYNNMQNTAGNSNYDVYQQPQQPANYLNPYQQQNYESQQHENGNNNSNNNNNNSASNSQTQNLQSNQNSYENPYMNPQGNFSEQEFSRWLSKESKKKKKNSKNSKKHSKNRRSKNTYNNSSKNSENNSAQAELKKKNTTSTSSKANKSSENQNNSNSSNNAPKNLTSSSKKDTPKYKIKSKKHNNENSEKVNGKKDPTKNFTEEKKQSHHPARRNTRKKTTRKRLPPPAFFPFPPRFPPPLGPKPPFLLQRGPQQKITILRNNRNQIRRHSGAKLPGHLLEIYNYDSTVKRPTVHAASEEEKRKLEKNQKPIEIFRKQKKRDPCFYLCWDHTNSRRGCPRADKCKWIHVRLTCPKVSLEKFEEEENDLKLITTMGAKIQWINDDLCIAVFPSQTAAQEALNSVSTTHYKLRPFARNTIEPPNSRAVHNSSRHPFPHQFHNNNRGRGRGNNRKFNKKPTPNTKAKLPTQVEKTDVKKQN